MSTAHSKKRGNEPRHFLDLDQFETSSLRRILDLALALKRGDQPFGKDRPLSGRILAMIFEKPSTRTRVSFEVGMKQLGGDSVVLTKADSQLGRGETVADTARVLSRYVNAIMIRTDKPQKLTDLAAYASVPVINGLTDSTHPCQVMADVMTYEEHRGPLKDRVVTWIGDGNNVAVSWIHAAAHFGCVLRLACPEALMPSSAVIEAARRNGARIEVVPDPVAAAREADLILTDTWVSMGEADAKRKEAVLAGYQVNDALMALTRPDSLFMHCLPAHRGLEVTDSVLDGPHSVVWDEAENRMHVQKGILSWCLL